MSKTKKPTRQERQQSFGANIQKRFGKSHFRVAADTHRPSYMIPMNCLPMDQMLGGGFQAGRLHLLWGRFSGGKSTTCLKALANLQKMCADCFTFIRPREVIPPLASAGGGALTKWKKLRLKCRECGEPYHNKDRPPVLASAVDDDAEDGAIYCEGCGLMEVDLLVPPDDDEEWSIVFGASRCECGNNSPTYGLYVDFEDTLDHKWAKALGVDLTRVFHEVPAYGEQGIDLIRSAIVDGVADMIIIDSIANVSTSEEIAKSAGQKTMAGTALMMNRFLRQLPGLISQGKDKHGVRATVMAINQVRSTTGQFAGHTLFGGQGQKFAASTITKFTKSKAEVDKIQVGAEGRREFLGVSAVAVIEAQCDKNKTNASSGMECQFRLVKADDGLLKKGEIDDYSVTMRQGKETGTIRKVKSGWEVEGWPVIFRIEGDLKMELHKNQFFKMHVHAEIIRRCQDEWEDVKLTAGKKTKEKSEDEDEDE